jgi:3',5'-cyclic AMP phosphodiesterase CpdA
MNVVGKIIQVSDFHFTPQLTQEKRRFYERRLRSGCHSFTKLVSLARCVDRLQRQDEPADVFLVTGDLATDGSPKSLRTCLWYIEKDELRAGNPSQVYTIGLDAGPNRRVVLPGNHDRWDRSYFGFQVQGAVFERVLNLPTTYPYVVGLRRPEYRDDPDDPAVLMFVFDSSPGVFTRFWPWDRLARGRVEPGTLDSFYRQAEQIERSGTVRGLRGGTMRVRYKNCLRIALLHHHPFDCCSTTLMENSDEFVRYCVRAGMHLVLFGHDHKEFWVPRFGQSVLDPNPYHQTIFFCCPSATEFRSEQGFYSFHVDQQGVNFAFYKWLNGNFVPGGLDENNHFLRGAPQRFHFSRLIQ